MGRVCDICRRERPNESFGGGHGQRAHVCNKCMKMPKQQRKLLLAEMELFSFLAQTHISDRNFIRIRQLAESPNPDISLLATEMLEVLSNAPALKKKKGKRSVRLTKEISSNVFARWHKAKGIPDDNTEGEQHCSSLPSQIVI